MNKHEKAAKLIWEFINQNYPHEDAKVLYGEQAGEFSASLDPDLDAIYLICSGISYHVPDSIYVGDIIEDLFNHLKAMGISMNHYERNNNSILTLYYDFDNPYTEEGRKRKADSYIVLGKDEETKLTADLKIAHEIAMAKALEIDPMVGTANFDYCILTLKNYSQGVIEGLCKKLRISCHKSGHRLAPKYWISGKGLGRGRNSIYCDIMEEELEKMGYNTCSYSRMD